MKRIYWVILLVIYTYILSTTSLDKRSCFQFTWVGPKTGVINCTKGIPCVKPFDRSYMKPNTTEIWMNRNTGMRSYFCTLGSDNVCIKYTYIYNGAVVNVSYLCGKVIEDQTSAIIRGCYTQHTEGYTIETCACRSRSNSMPCNSTRRNTFSMLITGVSVVTLFLYKISIS